MYIIRISSNIPSTHTIYVVSSRRPDSMAGGCPGRGPPSGLKISSTLGKKGNFFDLW